VARFAAPDPGGRSYKRIAYALGTGWLSGERTPSRCPAGKGTWAWESCLPGIRNPGSLTANGERHHTARSMR
jgi:hypothetical protein